MTPQNPASNQTSYSSRTVDDYLEQIDANVQDSLAPEQRLAVRAALEAALPKSNPKVVDLRVNIDLIFTRFYIVLFVGKDRRKKLRETNTSGGNVIANRAAALILLVGINLTVSLFIFLTAYLAKSALGINLFAHHLGDYLGH